MGLAALEALHALLLHCCPPQHQKEGQCALHEVQEEQQGRVQESRVHTLSALYNRVLQKLSGLQLGDDAGVLLQDKAEALVSEMQSTVLMGMQ